jgi:hypothetical protein
MGGAFGEFRGSCSVLSGAVKELGEDMAGWLAAPEMNAQLRDLK